MPSMPESIMRFTALPPPPPTPTTFMRAPVIGGSSSMKIFMLLPGSRTSGVMGFSSPPNLPNREGVHGLFRLFWVGRTTGLYILRTIYCAIGAPAYNTWSKNTTTKTIAKLGNEMRQASRATALCRARALFQRVRSMRNQRESGRGCPRRALNVFNETSKTIALRITNADRSVENLLRSFDHAVEQRAAAS